MGSIYQLFAGEYKDMKKKDTIYYARILPKTNTYDLCELSVRTVADKWFVAIDKRDKHAFYFNNCDVGKTVFYDREEALNKVREAEKSVQQKTEDAYTFYYEE